MVQTAARGVQSMARLSEGEVPSPVSDRCRTVTSDQLARSEGPKRQFGTGWLIEIEAVAAIDAKSGAGPESA